MDDKMVFQNLTESNMSFDDVFERILSFVKDKPAENYRLIIGTDSQVHKMHTRFITGVVIQREGSGVWACYRKTNVPRKIHSLQEKVTLETTFTQEIAYLFTPDKQDLLLEALLPYLEQGASLKMEGHLDLGIGKKNKTRKYVNEMVERIEAMGLEAQIKPNSFVASSYANKYTK